MRSGWRRAAERLPDAAAAHRVENRHNLDDAATATLRPLKPSLQASAQPTSGSNLPGMLHPILGRCCQRGIAPPVAFASGSNSTRVGEQAPQDVASELGRCRLCRRHGHGGGANQAPAATGRPPPTPGRSQAVDETAPGPDFWTFAAASRSSRHTHALLRTCASILGCDRVPERLCLNRAALVDHRRQHDVQRFQVKGSGIPAHSRLSHVQLPV